MTDKAEEVVISGFTYALHGTGAMQGLGFWWLLSTWSHQNWESRNQGKRSCWPTHSLWAMSQQTRSSVRDRLLDTCYLGLDDDDEETLECALEVECQYFRLPSSNIAQRSVSGTDSQRLALGDDDIPEFGQTLPSLTGKEIPNDSKLLSNQNAHSNVCLSLMVLILSLFTSTWISSLVLIRMLITPK